MSSVEMRRSVWPTCARIQRSGSVPDDVCSLASCSTSCWSSDSEFVAGCSARSRSFSLATVSASRSSSTGFTR